MTKIMVVDDDESFLELATIFLEKEGYEAVTAASGKECLSKLEEEDPDLVLLDVMMPDLDGWDTYERIKAEEPDMKVAFLSALESVPDLESTGISDYIIKSGSLTRERFIRRIRRIVGGP